MKEYMDGIESYKVLSGNIREVGAKAEMTVLMGEKKIIMIARYDCVKCRYFPRQGDVTKDICRGCHAGWRFILLQA